MIWGQYFAKDYRGQSVLMDRVFKFCQVIICYRYSFANIQPRRWNLSNYSLLFQIFLFEGFHERATLCTIFTWFRSENRTSCFRFVTHTNVHFPLCVPVAALSHILLVSQLKVSSWLRLGASETYRSLQAAGKSWNTSSKDELSERTEQTVSKYTDLDKIGQLARMGR